jgi:NAD(P)-dependent dehydrogenase (short-subunit alcohol dehydrogenase family)
MSKEPRPLAGKVVAITGGARGIGRATAEALQRKGANVAIGDVDGDGARRTAGELGGGVLGFDLDVTERESFTEFIDAVEEAHGPLDVLVNNAGVMPAGPFLEESDETALRQVDINVHGVILGMKIALPRMLERGSGHIVNLASMAGKGGFPGIATYCATKHAVVGVTEAVRAEVGEQGIDFTMVMPSFVNTELISGATRPRGVKIPEPEEVADAIVDALEYGKVDVFMPKSLGPLNRFGYLLPRAAREWMGRAFKADRILTEIDWDRRAAYERRVARSEPSRAAEPAETVAEADEAATAEPAPPEGEATTEEVAEPATRT